MINILFIIFGLLEGIAVGVGIAAILILVDIIYKVVVTFLDYTYINVIKVTILLGCSIFSILYFFPIYFSLNIYFSIFAGLFMGIFIGLLISSLAEVLNILPIFLARTNIENKKELFLWSMIIGKVSFSIVYFIIFKR